MKSGQGSDHEKEVIRRKFSRAARNYELYARVQKECAGYLLDTLPGGFHPDFILEIGCGSGSYSRLLAERYPEAALTALDFSEEMLAAARRSTAEADITFLREEAEEYLARTGERFALVTSNATLQWFRDLPGAFANLAGLLKSGGLVHVSVFGPKTLGGVGEALRRVVDSAIRLPSEKFADQDLLREAAAPYFGSLEIRERNFAWRCSSFLDLLKQIRQTGTGGFTENPPRLTRARMAELDEILRRQSGEQAGEAGYTVAYQVFFLTAAEPLRLERDPGR